MARPARAFIDLEAIRHNYRLAKQLAPQSKALAIIKANAYGHGAVAVAQALQAEADGFGVACIEEALELRESAVYKPPILLLEGVFTPDEMQLVDKAALTIVLHTEEQVQWLLQAKPSRAIDVFVKVDTGMHRLGFAADEVKALYGVLQQCAHVGQITLMTHFARADETQSDFTMQQMLGFKQAMNGLSVSSSLANSPSTLAWPEAHGDWIRPGLMLYGADPLDQANAASMQLRPAMTLESAVIAVHELNSGDAIGYGGRFRCDKPSKVATVAMGYGDGYPRHAKDGTPVVLNGQVTRLIGRVSMDMLTIDATGMEVKVSDPVQLWGQQVLATEVAAASDTIAYTLFTGLTRRVSRIYD